MNTPVAPTIGVVIVSYNTRALLEPCLRSLLACPLPLRVVVVDNASADESAALVRTSFPQVQLHALAANVGFAAATNHGLRALGFADQPAAPDPPPYALLLNPDTVLAPDALAALTAFLEAHPRVGLVGPRLCNPDGSLQTAAFRFPTLAMSVLDMFPPGEALPGRLYGSWWHGRYPHEGGADPFPIDHPLGACMLVRRAVVQEVGLLDERYFLYSEEVDWCWRIRQAGWAIWQEPAAQVVHVGGAATSQFRHRSLVALHQSRVQFFQQHYPPHFLLAHRLVTRLGMLRASLRAWAAYLRGTLPRAELRARLWAYGRVAML